MSKRFTDTDKWKKPFVRGLEGAYKLLWFYILDDCDHAGIWHVDIEVASIRIGTDISYPNAAKEFSKHIVVFDNNEKWFIPDFIEFQYGELNPANRVHNSVIKQLSKYNLVNNKGHLRPLKGAKDKDKEKDKEKDCYRSFKHLSISNSEIETLKESYSIKQIDNILDSIENYKLNKNYTSLFITASNWLKNEKPKNNDPTGRRQPDTLEDFKFE